MPEVKEIIVKEDGLKYCPHCDSVLDRVIVEIKGYAYIRVQHDTLLSFQPFDDEEIDEYLSFECRECGGLLDE